ncbi:MAG: cytochrome b/b6 domain-containing protein [Zoogloeaceae bacterium]|jgi:cytochrome b|nr:cytochrome b/b6 domain-containing protein [Zoogloeaceae bacterium]
MKIKLWDLPLRLFHWALAASVVSAFVTAKIGGNAMVWHGRAGLAIIGLLAFRIVWGFTGSTHSRFASFIKGPAAIKAYLRGQWHGIGHNPLGALSVLALLTLLSIQAATGLFANDDISYRGYLSALVSSDTSSRITGIHKLLEPLLMILVVLHLTAIAFYTRVKKDNLLMPMITGWKNTSEPVEPPRGGSFIAFLIAVLIGSAAACAASGALLTPPPPPAAEETPDF